VDVKELEEEMEEEVVEGLYILYIVSFSLIIIKRSFSVPNAA